MRRPMLVSACHLVGNLSAELYTPPQCLAELLRNSMVASMPNGAWEPKKARIEIMLVPNHPLVKRGDKALVFLDHGCGLTDAALERYFYWLGTPVSRLRETFEGNGASQKNIGRVAAFAMNANCVRGDMLDRINNGYYILTRTGPRGDVRFVRFIPRQFEDEGGIETERFIPANSTEMRGLETISGSFTAIVVPTPIFDSHEEIKDAIRWVLPRELDKMCEVTIGGQAIAPPPLESTITVSSVDGQFRARLGVAKDSEHGAWLCDSTTGFRVGSCEEVGRILPDPIWSPELVGDIFAPDLLKFQNTARSCLTREFFRKSNKTWQKFFMWLIRDVVPRADELIRRDSITGDAADTLTDIVDMFNECYGPPEKELKEKVPRVRPVKPGPPEPPGPEKDPGEKRERHISIRIRDETYLLYKGKTLNPHLFAEMSPNNEKMVYVNVRGGYASLPRTKTTRLEHCLMQILLAVAHSKYPHDPREATMFANKVRSEFKK